MKLPASSFYSSTICVLFFLCASLVSGFAIDREAFSISSYDLNLQVEPEQHRLGVRGKITLRNDSGSVQKIAVLQVSSSLDWRAVKVADKPVQFVTQPYASDIDHTGELSEAVVTLPQSVEPHGMVNLEIAYEGVILLDTTRLTRIGTPEDEAQTSDWDRIGPDFSAVRGAGHVAWYPIMTEVANLSEENSLFDVLGRWKAREAGAKMEIHFQDPTFNRAQNSPVVLCSGEKLQGVTLEGTSKFPFAQCTFSNLNQSAPTFVIANYGIVTRPSMSVYNLPEHAAAAEAYAEAAEKVVPLISDWFGPPRQKAQAADLPEEKAAPFESGALLLTPLSHTDSTLDGLAAAHQLTHASLLSFRPWIDEGLAHFAQALYMEQQKNRRAALDYMGVHRAAFVAAEEDAAAATSEVQARQSLINTTSEELYRSKAMFVWWMLRDMVGEAALKKALAEYRVEQDKEPSYIQKLIQPQTQKDLEWFFDDWVYRDRGLPEFKVESAFARKTMTNAYIVTITIDNLGSAGAEVPLTVKFAGGESIKRLEVRAKDKATIRVETPATPAEIVVNDGSVPESNMGNNVFKVTAQ
jgi:hypothetical protein